MDPTHELEERIADACLGAREGEELAADAVAIGVPPARLAIYRRIVRNNLGDAAKKLLPRTFAAMEAEAPGAFGAEVASFLDANGPRTHYLRDLPEELVAWAGSRWSERSDLPAYAADLARHEIAEFAVGIAPAAPPAAAIDAVALDRPVVLRGPIRVERYRFAVPESDDEPGPPPARVTAVYIHRDAEDLVHTAVVSAFRASVLERLIAGDPLGDAVKRGCDAAGAALSDAALADVAEFLAELADRGVLAGALAD